MSVPAHFPGGGAMGQRGGSTRQALNQSPGSCPHLNSGLAHCGLVSRRCQLASGVKFQPPTPATLGTQGPLQSAAWAFKQKG